MKIYPHNDQVLISRARPEETTKFGLFIPSSAQNNSSEGIVLAVGKGKVLPSGVLQEPTVKRDDRVIFDANKAREIEVDGEKFIMIRNDDILAVLEK